MLKLKVEAQSQNTEPEEMCLHRTHPTGDTRVSIEQSIAHTGPQHHNAGTEGSAWQVASLYFPLKVCVQSALLGRGWTQIQEALMSTPRLRIPYPTTSISHAGRHVPLCCDTKLAEDPQLACFSLQI